MRDVRIRPFTARDAPEVYSLWARTLSGGWPLSYEAFTYKLLDRRAFRPGDHIVAEIGSELVGVAATQAPEIPGDDRRHGELMLLIVDAAHRRKGVGKRLHAEALRILQRRGVSRAHLGSGGLGYFWPGVPRNLPDAWPFVQSVGWAETGAAYDLMADLRHCSTPGWVYERIRSRAIDLASPGPEDAAPLLDFVGRHIPRWAVFYRADLERLGLPSMVVAKDARGRILGSSYAVDSRATDDRHDVCVWHEVLGVDIGGVGPLLVDENARRQGIGLALAARVTEMLTTAGLRTAFVGYTALVDWYGKLGYRPWREYILSERAL